jgi:hypothetical protein
MLWRSAAALRFYRLSSLWGAIKGPGGEFDLTVLVFADLGPILGKVALLYDVRERVLVRAVGDAEQVDPKSRRSACGQFRADD